MCNVRDGWVDLEQTIGLVDGAQFQDLKAITGVNLQNTSVQPCPTS